MVVMAKLWAFSDLRFCIAERSKPNETIQKVGNEASPRVGWQLRENSLGVVPFAFRRAGSLWPRELESRPIQVACYGLLVVLAAVRAFSRARQTRLRSICTAISDSGATRPSRGRPTGGSK